MYKISVCRRLSQMSAGDVVIHFNTNCLYAAAFMANKDMYINGFCVK